MKSDLLEDLLFMSGVPYLSCLRYPEWFFALEEGLSQLNKKDYSLDEWNRVATYLTGKAVHLKSIDDVISIILKMH